MNQERNTVRFLAVLTVVSGMVGLLGGIVVIGSIGDDSLVAGIPRPYLLISWIFTIGLGLATGVGMWLGRPWGWWLATYYFLWKALNGLTGVLGSLSSEPSMSVLRQYGWDVFFGTVLVIYLCRENSREYFGVGEQAKWKPLLILFAAAVGTLVAFFVLMLVTAFISAL